MALSVPATPPDWASSATGLARRVEPAVIAPDGYDVNDVPASTHLNYTIGVLCDFAKYIFDPDSFSAPVLITQEADVRHAVRTTKLGASQMDALSGFAHDTAQSTMVLLASSGTGEIYVDIPVNVGDRLKEVRVVCRALGAASADITAKLEKLVAVVGDASPTASTPVSTVNSLASANIQAITLTPTADTVGAGEMFAVRIHGANTAGDKNIYAVEVDTDRVA